MESAPASRPDRSSDSPRGYAPCKSGTVQTRFARAFEARLEATYLRDIGRAQYTYATDDEALKAFSMLCKLEPRGDERSQNCSELTAGSPRQQTSLAKVLVIRGDYSR